MAIKFKDKDDESKPAEKAPGSPPRAAAPQPEAEPSPKVEPQLPFAKPTRPEKKRKGK